MKKFITLSLGMSLIASCALTMVACQGSVDFPNYDPSQDVLDQGLGGDDDIQGEDIADTPEPDMPQVEVDMPDLEEDMPGPTPDMPDGDAPEPDMPPVDPILSEEGMLVVALPALNSKNCTDNTCHGPGATGEGNNFSLTPDPNAPNDITSDLIAFTGKVDFAAPANSRLLQKGRDNHRFAKLDDVEYCAIFDWIDAADGNADNVCNPP